MFARLCLLAIFASSCVYDDTVPPGASLFCDADDDCPSAQLCDTAAHLCRAPDGDVSGPSYVDVVASPSAAASGVRVTLTLTADEPLTDAVLTFAGGVADPGFTLDDVDGARATLSFVVDDATPEVFFVPQSAHLTDAANNDSTVPIAPNELGRFRVDRTSPSIVSVTLTDELDDGLLLAADDPSADEITVVADLAEEAIVDVTVGGLALSCAPVAGTLAQRCTGLVARERVQHGSNTVRIRAVDAAGNESEAPAQLDVDLLPPAVDRAELLVDGEDTGGASLGTVLDLSLIVDEPLAVPPVVVLDTPDRAPLQVVSGAGRVWELRAIVGEVFDDGDVDVLATLDDRFGHRAVDLPVARVSLSVFPRSRCDTAGICPDVDGDGAPGATLDCPPTDTSDCDDDDPFVHPGALEIPGDLVRNDCGEGADTPLDETTAVFVAPAGSDAGVSPGTRGAPFATLAAAMAEAASSDRVVVMEAGVHAIGAATDSIDVSVLGGFVRDGASWTRDPSQRSTLAFAVGGAIVMSGALLSGVAMANPLDLFGFVHIDDVAVGNGLFVAGPVFARGLSVDGTLFLDRETRGSRVLDSRFAANVSVSETDTHLARISAAELIVSQGASVTMVNSLLEGLDIGSRIVVCDRCTSIAIAFSNIVVRQAPTRALEASPGPVAPSISLIGNIIQMHSGDTVLALSGGAAVTMRDNLVAFSGGQLLESPAATIPNTSAGLIQLSQCSWSGCRTAGGNVIGTVALTLGDPLHLAAVPGSDVFNAGPTDLAGVPPEAVADVDGDCRMFTGSGPPHAGAEDR